MRPVKPSWSVVVARTFTSAPSERVGQALAHLVAARGDARLLADQDAVGVHDRPPRLAHLPVRLAQQLDAVGAAEPLVSRREQRADVAEPGGAEDRIGERMRDHVAVGVAREPTRVIEPHAAEHERDAVRERVRVDAHADTKVTAAPPGSSSSESDADRLRRRFLQIAPRPAADVHAGHPGGDRRARRRCRRGRPRRRSSQPGRRRARRRARRTPASGFQTPRLSDDATRVDERCELAARRTRACCRTHTRGSRLRADARGTAARRDTSRPSPTSRPACSMPSIDQTSSCGRSSAIVAPSPAISVNGVTPAASATRVHMFVSSTSVSPTSKTTASTATQRPARGRPAWSP